MKSVTRLRDIVAKWRRLESQSTSLLDLLDLAIKEDDDELSGDIYGEAQVFYDELDKGEIELTLSGIYDQRPAIISIHAGAGGVDSQDWSKILLRMYTRWAENQGYGARILDLTPGEEGGVKNVVIEFTGTAPYGYLWSEVYAADMFSIFEDDYILSSHTGLRFRTYILEKGDSDDPMLSVHTQAEGTVVYTTLFYIPKKAPFDLYYPEYKAGVKLYINRVFITDDDKELMPTYLRFIKGVIDSEDLPLNVSREILQQNRVLSKIKSNSVKKILSEITKLSNNKEKYTEFYKEFGRPIKEGLYQDHENKDTLIELIRFHTTKSDEMISFKDYTKGMGKSQKNIYFLTGADKNTLKKSPLLEMYKKKNIEVCLFDDEIDDIVLSGVFKYKEIDLKSVNHSDATEELKNDKKDSKEAKTFDPLIKRMKSVLNDNVKDIKTSNRLTDSPCCLVADQNDPTAKMQEMMKAMGQSGGEKIKPIMEINPSHGLIKKIHKLKKGKAFDRAVHLLYDQALMLEGIKIEDPADFVKRLNDVLTKSL